MINYTLVEGFAGYKCNIEVASLKDARNCAIEWAKNGDYNMVESTFWVDIIINDEDGDIVETVTVPIDPEEPECADGYEHDWQSPIELVGGIKENPGVWGNDGGVIITEACVNCFCKKTTNTWAHRSDTGECGLTSIKYEEDAFNLEE